jgi:hypothetical protein
MVCHGELVRRKPDPRYLTEFYLLVASGGAIGGVLVGIVAPLVFENFLEWHIGVNCAFILCVGLLLLAGSRRRHRLIRTIDYLLFGFLASIALCELLFLATGVGRPLDRARSFFGVVYVTDVGDGNDPPEPFLLLVNGRTRHGAQFADPAKRRQPTAYYGERDGVGRAIRYLQQSGPIRIGAVGLGAGTLATYARPGDSVVFYEINPQDVRMAQQHFTYLKDCRGEVQIAMGDARLTLEAQLAAHEPQRFDLLVVDAFSGDTIPTHLLTREALAVYRRHLASHGVVAFHISNIYLDLAPVVRRLAEDCRMRWVRIENPEERQQLLFGSTWMLLTENEAFVRAVPSDPPNFPAAANVPLWTDQYSNLFGVLKPH